MILEYHEKLYFTKLEYLTNGRFLHISEIVTNHNIVCENVLLGYFCQIK